MGFDIVNFSLASAVADNGTVTVGYPANRSKGSYALSDTLHKLIVNGNLYSAPQDFTLTFNANASSITLTNKSGGSWPASALCKLQLERIGPDNGKLALLNSTIASGRVSPVLPVVIDLGSPNVADADGYCVSQDLTSAGVFSVSTTAAAAIAAAALAGYADVPRNVVAAWTGTAILTITGKDEYGNTVVEKSGSGTSLTGKKAFKQITGISSSANITSLTVGTGDVLGLPVALRKAGQVLGELKDGQLVGRAPAKVRLPFYLDVTDTGVGTAASAELIAPFAGVISGLTVVVRTAISTGGDVTAAVGTTAVDGLTVTVANSATKGTTASDTPTAGHASTVVAKGDRIQVIAADAFNGGGDLEGYIEITPTEGLTDGVFVPAVATEATATTGDVRGTYDPADAMNGDIGIKLLALLTDPADLGVAQYAG